MFEIYPYINLKKVKKENPEVFEKYRFHLLFAGDDIEDKEKVHVGQLAAHINYDIILNFLKESGILKVNIKQ